MVAIRARDADALTRRLTARQIITSHRDGNLRAGFHLYNNEEDLERLVWALNDNRDLLALNASVGYARIVARMDHARGIHA